METLPLPSKIELTPDPKDLNHATIIIEPCYPGYGTTLGNALRRVLLSSLPGAAITRVRIKGVDHEFSTIPNVKEDAVDIILNLKQIRVKLHEGESGVMTLKVKGEKVVKAKDIETPSNLEVTNGDLVIATLTDKSAELEMELHVGEGRGYVPVEAQIGEKAELGMISLDAIYTPVKTVNFENENVRVGQMTNFDRLTLNIVTDGTVSPANAFHQSTDILVNHFSLLNQTQLSEATIPKKRARKKAESEKEETGTSEPSASEEA